MSSSPSESVRVRTSPSIDTVLIYLTPVARPNVTTAIFIVVIAAFIFASILIMTMPSGFYGFGFPAMIVPVIIMIVPAFANIPSNITALVMFAAALLVMPKEFFPVVQFNPPIIKSGMPFVPMVMMPIGIMMIVGFFVIFMMLAIPGFRNCPCT